MSTLALLLVLFFCSLSSMARAETIGVIVTRQTPFFEKAHAEFKEILVERGYAKNLKFIVQRPQPDPIAWSNASRKLIAADVDYIVTFGTSATLAAVEERSAIPIIFSAFYEPLLPKVKGKATGVCTRLQVKNLVRYLKQSVDDKKLGVLYCSHEEDSQLQFAEVKSASDIYGLEVKELNLQRPADIASVLSTMDVTALFVTSSSIVSSVYPTVLRMAKSKKIVTASLIYNDDDLSTIMYTSSPEEHGRMTAEILIKALQGVPVEQIPFACTGDLELVYNLKEARSMGIRIPMDLVTEATKVIF